MPPPGLLVQCGCSWHCLQVPDRLEGSVARAAGTAQRCTHASVCTSERCCLQHGTSKAVAMAAAHNLAPRWTAGSAGFNFLCQSPAAAVQHTQIVLLDCLLIEINVGSIFGQQQSRERREGVSSLAALVFMAHF